MLKRDGILFRRGLIPAFVLTLLLGLSSGLAAYAVMQSAREGAAPVKVAVVDEEGGVISRMAVNLVRSQNFIASLMDLEPVKKAEALEGLESGLYQAAIILPDGYTNHIRFGTAGSGQIILTRAAAASGDVVSSLAKFGELLLAAGQYGIFAGEELIAEKDISQEFLKYYLEEGNDRLFDQAFSLYDEGILQETAPYSGSGISTEAYYAAAWLSFFLLMGGLFFTALYTEDAKKPMLIRLFGLSVTPGNFLFGKFLYPFLFRLPVFAAGLVLLNKLLPLRLHALSLLGALLSLLMASVLISGAAVALGQKKGWQGFLIALSTLGLFLCGGLIPRSMLPAWLTEIGRFTPFGAVLSGLKPLWGGQADIPSLLLGLGLSLLVLYGAYGHVRDIPRKGADV